MFVPWNFLFLVYQFLSAAKKLPVGPGQTFSLCYEFMALCSSSISISIRVVQAFCSNLSVNLRETLCSFLPSVSIFCFSFPFFLIRFWKKVVITKSYELIGIFCDGSWYVSDASMVLGIPT